MARLTYLSVRTIETLRDNIVGNLDRYTTTDFSDLMSEGEWSIELGLDVDLAPLADLDPARTEIENSKLVWRVLGNLKPSLAYEEGIWARLAHVECLKYARQRWLAGITDPADLEQNIGIHFFARTLNMRRDDNAISRLWYNGHIAKQTIPDDQLPALDVMLRRADSRLTLLERSLTGSRPALASGVVRAANHFPWINASQGNFRRFMKTVNLLGGGKVFEAMTPEDIHDFMAVCATRAGMPEETNGPASVA
ncbi:hypothetical protein CU102_12595 [Phyllobacterium brassicacearum]|uniref:Uncharacterized protein n=1 Tax=Phyllobacterium brassicacearum TaxID=314235 RepID=A0A2P7BQ70_9HYPH|nr:DUF6339 family protein [Phyllobacterium brassicacearum]PSH68596.1 hypothetical protein CU102_12595 [Phyllobacterium brassicacearum]TDQ24145.1 hypothetical protein DEV91_11523 [Phyllobacterium brassicacearum]